MENVYDSIITRLTEVIEDVKSGEKELERNVIHAEHVEECNAEDVEEE